ncbi:hypothetical protein A7M48_20390 [Acinetobacter baumannii]|nr:hypothetical protein A7M48_20390 [Acinetobacter baumannii]
MHISQLAAPFRFNEVQTKIFSIRAKANQTKPNRAATEKTNDLKRNEKVKVENIWAGEQQVNG